MILAVSGASCISQLDHVCFAWITHRCARLRIPPSEAALQQSTPFVFWSRGCFWVKKKRHMEIPVVGGRLRCFQHGSKYTHMTGRVRGELAHPARWRTRPVACLGVHLQASNFLLCGMNPVLPLPMYKQLKRWGRDGILGGLI